MAFNQRYLYLNIYKPAAYAPAKNCEKCNEFNYYLCDKEYFCKKCGVSLNPGCKDQNRED